MRRINMAMKAILFSMACSLVIAGDVYVERVIPSDNKTKSTLTIQFSQQVLVPFEAQFQDAELRLILPQVTGTLDVSQIDLNQVSAFSVESLGPQLGTVLVCTLKEGATYRIFDGSPGELILFFESSLPLKTEVAVVQSIEPQPEIQAVEASNVETPEENQTEDSGLFAAQKPESADVQESVSASDLQLTGPVGLQRLHAITLVPGEVGKVFLAINGDYDYKTFFLDNPKRFVLDLKNIIISLDNNQLDAPSALIQRIRARQFQSQPIPITRIVLDLHGQANIAVQSEQNGVAVFFGEGEFDIPEEPLQSDVSIAQVETPREAKPVALETAETTEPLVANAGTLEKELDPSALTPAELPALQLEPLNVVVQPTHREIVAGSDSWSMEPEVAGLLTVDEKVTEGQVEALSTASAPSHAVETPSNNNSEEAANIGERLATPQPEEQVVASEVVASEPQPQTNAPAVTTDDGLPPADNSAMVSEEPQVAMADTQVQPLIEPVAIAPTPEKPVEIIEPSLVLQKALAAAQEKTGSNLNTSPESAVSEIKLANAKDFEVFQDAAQTSYYEALKDVPVLKRENKTLIVTNEMIAKSKQLQETRVWTPRAPSAYQSGDNLFNTPAAEATGFEVEVIDSGEPKYQGHKISLIDVKNVEIVDLLRFITSEFGINLYVDQSVNDLKATYQFRNIPWDQALDIILKNANLDKEFQNGIMRVATIEKFKEEERLRQELRIQKELSVPVSTVYFPLSYAKVEEVVPLVEQYLSPRGTVLQDERTNTLIIEDIPKRMTSIRNLIQRLDKQIPQVTIEARIVETTERFLRELGVQWGLSGNYQPELGTETGLDFPNRATVGGPNIGNTSLGAGRGLLGGYAVDFPVIQESRSGIGFQLGNFLDNFKLDLSLQLAESTGQGKIISSPKITTQNNKMALIQSGQRVPIQTINRGTITVQYVDAVLQLEVTPHITAEGTIIMDLVVDKSEPDFTRTVLGNPVINISKAETRVLVKDGGTTVIGGIYTLNEQNADSGIPVLKEIPIIKRLFSSELRSIDNKELLIFLTPRIVKY